MMDLNELFALDAEDKLSSPDPINLDVAATIKRRRRQLLVHSYLYYRMNTSIIDDHTYDQWARELIDLQAKHPEESKQIEYYQDFKDFQMGDSFGLPLEESWIHTQANRLLDYKQ